MSRKNKSRIKTISMVIYWAMVLWFFASWANICAHNTTDYIYWKFNLINLMFK